jgi:predicted glycoside hydrolase/deacetylase ChbG (UPF0249 family)
MTARRLIVNADDFGQSAGVTEGIIRCHRDGIVTSASLMVRWPRAAEAAAYARAHPDFSVGLHLDLGEWVCRDRTWTMLYEVVAPDDPPALEREIAAQLDEFRRLTGCEPTHIDSHQHVHQSEPAATVVSAIARGLGVPLRHVSGGITYCGDFYGQSAKGDPIPDAITVERLIEILRALPAGTTELGCHPGLAHDAIGMYVVEREQEVGVLCEPRVRAAIDREGIELISFRDVPRG